MAGHSSGLIFSIEKEDKMLSDQSYSLKFLKPTVAAKMGDPDVDKNPRLRLAVKEARSNSVPGSYRRAIKIKHPIIQVMKILDMKVMLQESRNYC